MYQSVFEKYLKNLNDFCFVVQVCMDKNKNNVDQLSVEDVESKLTNIWDVVYFCW